MSQEPITTYCPACGKAFRVPPDLNGKKILCKTCQTHFVVQADRPGLPALPPPPPTRPPGAAPHAPAAVHAPAPAPHPPTHAPHAPAATTLPAGHAGNHPATARNPATLKVPTAPASHPPVTAATATPIPVPPPPADDLAPIPFDDSPASDGPSVALPTVAKPAGLDKVKIESKGPYFVIKLVTAGKMIHVNIENVLNEHAADGWKLEQIITASGEAYAILSRFDAPRHSDGQATGQPASDTIST